MPKNNIEKAVMSGFYALGKRQGLRSLSAILLGSVMMVSAAVAQVASHVYVDGDPIGADNTTTDNTGGFTAVQQFDSNLGQPAILVSLDGQELLTEFRVITFGEATIDGELLFDQFNYHLDLWSSDSYFAGNEPEFQIELGQPANVELVSSGSSVVVPDTQFGRSGVGGGNAPTYDFRFDLTQLPMPSPLREPLPAGEWVFGFQSWHDTQSSGTLRVSGSMASDGPLPLFSRDSVPRGVLGGQDPNNLFLHWGMSLAAEQPLVNQLGGDFNGNGVVDAADFAIWRENLGASTESILNGNGDGLNGVDIGDYHLWRGNFGVSLPHSGQINDLPVGIDVEDYSLRRKKFVATQSAAQSEGASTPEPSGVILLSFAGCVFVLRKASESSNLRRFPSVMDRCHHHRTSMQINTYAPHGTSPCRMGEGCLQHQAS